MRGAGLRLGAAHAAQPLTLPSQLLPSSADQMAPLTLRRAQHNYMFEMYFWLEKVMLIGFISMLPKGSMEQWFVNVTVNLFFLSVILFNWPEKDYRCNRANLAMHIIFLYFSICTLLLNPRNDLTADYFSPQHINLALIVSQACLVIYMLHVIIGKLRKASTNAQLEVFENRNKAQGAAIIKLVEELLQGLRDSEQGGPDSMEAMETMENPTFETV